MKKFRLYFEEQNRGPLTQLWQQFQRQHAAVLGLVMFSFFFVVDYLCPLAHPSQSVLTKPGSAVTGAVLERSGVSAIPFWYR